MTDLMLRRRELMAPQDTGPKYAVDRKTNAPLMDICYAQGWAANEDYMTFEEAAQPITVSSDTFKNVFKGESLYELGYFTNMTWKDSLLNCPYKVVRLYPVNTPGPQFGYGSGKGDAPARLIDLGENIKSFHGWCFDYISDPTVIVFRANNVVCPPAWDFNGQNVGKRGNTVLYVPDDLVEGYEASSWGQYGNTIKPLSEYDEKKLVKQYLNQ